MSGEQEINMDYCADCGQDYEYCNCEKMGSVLVWNSDFDTFPNLGRAIIDGLTEGWLKVESRMENFVRFSIFCNLDEAQRKMYGQGKELLQPVFMIVV